MTIKPVSYLLVETPDRWTSVKDRIPTREERISWDKRGAILVASYDHYANERIIYISEDLTLYEEDEDVTHWMRLPKLPEIDNG